jgi:hypothetical protein
MTPARAIRVPSGDERYRTCNYESLCITNSGVELGRPVMNEEQTRELLYQALETELGGVEVYTTALRCVLNEELKSECRNTSNRRRIMSRSCAKSSPRLA